jgi:hypothetical protein
MTVQREKQYCKMKPSSHYPIQLIQVNITENEANRYLRTSFLAVLAFELKSSAHAQ